MSAWIDGRFCFLHVGLQAGQLLSSEECRRRAEEADELAQKSTDFGRRAYEESAQLWREMAERVERNNW